MNRSIRKILLFVVLLLFVSACASPPEDPEPLPASDSAGKTPQIVGLGTSAMPPGTSGNPIPPGKHIKVDQMAFSIGEVIRPADDVVAGVDMLNPEPGEGLEYVLVELVVVCEKEAEQSCSVSAEDYYEFWLAGPSGVEYAPAPVSGVPGLLEQGEFGGGETLSGYLAFLIPQDESDLMLVIQHLVVDWFYLKLP